MTLLIIYSFVVGLLFGSFSNVVIYRLPIMISRAWEAEAKGTVFPRFNLAVPRSACPGCGKGITALENIPVISWLMLRGKCSGCGVAISWRYPAVELLVGALFALCFYKFSIEKAVVASGLSLVLVWLFFIDYDTMLLPDDLTLPLVWAGLLVNMPALKDSVGFTSLPNAVVGAVAGYLAFWSLFWAFKLITGKEGMGYGDFKLLAALGAWFGWMALPSIVLLSSASAILFAVVQQVGKSKPFPFGPALVLAGLIYLFFPEIGSLFVIR